MKVNAFDLVTAQPWMITEDALRMICEIAQRHAGSDVEAVDVQALATRDSRPLLGSFRSSVRDRVAIVPIRGPMFRRANLMTEISGATSTETVAKDIRTALDDPQVDAILLEIDSPGGASAGINELSDMIFEARSDKDRKKPIVAYSDGQISSAAYFVASAADEIVLDAMGVAGSIGVVMQIRDTRAAEARAGVRTIEVVSSVSPDKRVDLDSDEGRAKLQRIVDDMADVFVAAVARNRGMSVKQVTSDFGQGGFMVGQRAVEAGMADRIGNFEQVLAELSQARTNRRSFSMSRTPTQAKGAIKVATTAALRAALEAGHTGEEITLQTEAADIEKLQSEARAAGATEATTQLEAAHKDALKTATDKATADERARITGLNKICVKGHEATVAAAISSGESVEATALKIAQKAAENGVTVASLAAGAPAPAPHGGAGSGDPPTGKKLWGSIVDKFNAAASKGRKTA